MVSIALLASVPVLRAESLSDVRARLEARVRTVDALKRKGVVGENNRGFLEIRSGDDNGVVAEENADREKVYAAVAEKTGASREEVGRARAKKIAENSAPGVWVQGDDGKWSKK